MKRAMSLLLMLSGMLVNIVMAQKPAVVVDNKAGWKKIGETTASFKQQNESITVLGADEFTAIKLKVKDAPLNIERLQVFYESGDMEEINVSNNLQAGAETRVIKLKEPYRDIEKIAFTYKTNPNTNGEKADVEVYGLKTDQKENNEAYRKEKTNDAKREMNEAERDAKREAKEVERDAKREAREAEDNAEDKADQVEDDIDRETDEAENNAEETENDVERAAKKTGDKISEVGAKGAAEITDRRHDTKVGPDGQVIYIDNNSKYYYVNKQGKKVYVTAMQLKDKPNDN